MAKKNTKKPIKSSTKNKKATQISKGKGNKKPAPKTKSAIQPVKKAKPVAKKATAKNKPTAKKVLVKKPAKPAAKATLVKKSVAKKVAPAPKKQEIAKPVKKQVPVAKVVSVKEKKQVTETKAPEAPRVPIAKTKQQKSKGPATPKVITAPITLPSPPQRNAPAKLKNEAKGKFSLEYIVHASPGIVYEFMTTPSGLSEWFADDVNIRHDIYTFFWDGSEQKALLLGLKEEKYIRLQWIDGPDNVYFEFRIEYDELTREVSLIITDFAENEGEKQTSKLLWDNQVNKLLHVLGSY